MFQLQIAIYPMPESENMIFQTWITLQGALLLHAMQDIWFREDIKGDQFPYVPNFICVIKYQSEYIHLKTVFNKDGTNYQVR